MLGPDLYVVGRVINAEAQAWEFMGVVDSLAAADAACKDERYFIGPTYLNQIVEDTKEWPGSWYPRFVDKTLAEASQQ